MKETFKVSVVGGNYNLRRDGVIGLFNNVGYTLIALENVETKGIDLLNPIEGKVSLSTDVTLEDLKEIFLEEENRRRQLEELRKRHYDNQCTGTESGLVPANSASGVARSIIGALKAS